MRTIVGTVLIVVFGFSSIFISANEPVKSNINNVEEDKATSSTSIGKSISATINTISTLNSFMLEEEMFIDDIPFDTEEVVNEMNMNELLVEDQLGKMFVMDNEEYIDDIPFNTSKISHDVMSK